MSLTLRSMAEGMKDLLCRSLLIGSDLQMNGDVSCSNGKHDFVLDEEVGLKCRYCSYVSVEIRDVSPTMDKYRANISDKKTCSDKKAGTTKLDERKRSVGKESCGCIISHSPGTGKTRLIIVFAQSYLEQFRESHPVVIAPASLMLTWEEEFKKRNSNIPFYNMSSQDFSGQENQSAV
ncbi:hypothetical protein F2Q69_00053187 [Brassica cretica]|uniref:SNF2 N-terminal domain-containing protein n=4 Tax=Brassica TaxID=3705 RepID=A0A0D3D4M7_BRAOL|nr:hypothetical protein F2Q69_00053187 [Brassica cretica]KAF3596255.1 hypothetical protein DY000_02022202 [Brassica cretica]VDD35930.1 unnamed protein product [Brassica oleracea]